MLLSHLCEICLLTGTSGPSPCPNYADHGELPHVHFTDGSVFNVDGTWKHGGKLLTSKEKKWLKSYGWKMPAGQQTVEGLG